MSNVKNRPDAAVAIPSIMSSNDTGWLTKFRKQMESIGEPRIVAEIDKRLRQLREDDLRAAIVPTKPLVDMVLDERVDNTVRVYQQILSHKHGRRQAPGGTLKLIRNWGKKGAVIRTIMTMRTSQGLETLAYYGALASSWEQIVLDFPNEFDDEVVAKAKKNLAPFERKPERQPKVEQ